MTQGELCEPNPGISYQAVSHLGVLLTFWSRMEVTFIVVMEIWVITDMGF